MNPAQFGRLAATLRKETRDENGLPLTQAALAARAGVSAASLGKLERGEKLPTDPALLPRLAAALGLSSRERREFFFAALGFQPEENSPQPPDRLVFESLFRVLEQTALPAFIVDSYDDIVAANALILRLFDFSAELRREAPRLTGGYNVLRFVFSSASGFAGLLGGGQEAYLRQSIAFFRAISLPVRATPYFQRLMRTFRADPQMEAFAWFYDTHPAQDAYFFEGLKFSLRHETLGELAFFSPPIYPAATRQGGLYLIPYLPASPAASQLCARLAADCPPAALRLAPWPQKASPPEGAESAAE